MERDQLGDFMGFLAGAAVISLIVDGDKLVARIKGATGSAFYNDVNRLRRLGYRFNEADKTWETSWSKVQVLLTLKAFGDSVALMQPRCHILDRQQPRVGAEWRSVDFVSVKNLLLGNLKIEPFDYQWRSVAYFYKHGGGLLADSMGIGKTLQGIMFIMVCLLEGSYGRFLIVPPSHLVLNWKKEFEKFTNLNPIVINGDRHRRVRIYDEISRSSSFVAIIGQEVLRQRDHWDLDQVSALRPEALVVDEAHHARNRDTLLNKALRKLHVKSKLLITGTPFQTRAEDVYALFEIYDKSIFGTLKNFRERYLIYQFNGRFKELIGYRNLDELYFLMSPHMIRRVRKDIGVESRMLPPQIITVEMNSDQEKLTAFYFEKLEELDDMIRSLIAIKDLTKDQKRQLDHLQNRYKSIFTKLQEAADCAALLNDTKHRYSSASPKADLIHDIIEEKLESGEKVVVFTRFKRFLDIIVNRIKEFNPAMIYHGVKDKDRQQVQDRFNTDSNCRVIVCTDAAQEGINLPGGSTLIHADLLWNDEAMNQRSMRIDRVDSQYDQLHVIKLVSAGSIEEAMLGKLAKRRAAGASIIGCFAR